MLKASIDIGSNSTLLLIMDVDSHEIVYEESTITSLGKNLDKTSLLSDQSMHDTYFTLKSYVEKCSHYSIDGSSIIASATEASRVAKNSKQFYENIKNTLSLNVRLITAKGEAYYTALGVLKMSKLKDENVVILDVGGASSELIKVNTVNFEIISTISLPVGSVRATDWIAENSYQEKIAKIFNDFDFKDYESSPVICVAGTLTTLALLYANAHGYNEKLINNLQISSVQLEEFVTGLEKSGKKPLEKFPFVGKRMGSIIGGSICSSHILKKIKSTNIFFSTYGLRYGTLLAGDLDERFCL